VNIIIHEAELEKLWHKPGGAAGVTRSSVRMHQQSECQKIGAVVPQLQQPVAGNVRTHAHGGDAATSRAVRKRKTRIEIESRVVLRPRK